MNNQLISSILSFFVYVFVQVFFLKNITLFDMALCFVYINFLLTLPQDIDHTLSILIAFLLGFLVDLFYGNLGVHSGASTLAAFVRPYLINFIIQKEKNTELTITEIGITSFSLYLLVMIIVHHSFVIFIEIANLQLFFPTLIRIMASTLFTFIVVLIIHFLFFSQKKV